MISHIFCFICHANSSPAIRINPLSQKLGVSLTLPGLPWITLVATQEQQTQGCTDSNYMPDRTKLAVLYK